MMVLVLGSCAGEAGDTNAPDVGSTSTRSAEQTEIAAVRDAPGSTIAPGQSVARVVEYVITSKPAAIVNLTYQNASGGTSQESGTRTPWSETMTMQAGGFAYVSAQGNEYAAEITCEIWVDGMLGATSTSSGAFVVVTCSGTVP